MTGTIKKIFLVLFILGVSTLLFSVVFGDIGRSLIWEAMEPVFQRTWTERTMNDGDTISYRLTEVFNEMREVTE